jgi:hypothetical protein
MPGPARALTSFGAPPMRIYECAEVVEPIGRDESSRYELPECVFDLCGKMAGDPDQICEETRYSVVKFVF